jgi:hypothetical protein
MSNSKCAWWSRAILTLAAAFAGATAAAAKAPAAVASAPARHRPSRHHATLEDRVRSLTKALALDAKQQAGVRKALQEQRGLVSKVWTDEKVAAAYKVRAVQGISERTAGQIRALLNEEQKKQYSPPRTARPAPDPEAPGVQSWMDAMNRK